MRWLFIALSEETLTNSSTITAYSQNQGAIKLIFMLSKGFSMAYHMYHTNLFDPKRACPGLTMRDMKTCKRLYNIAKRNNTQGDWNAYKRIKNLINVKLKQARNNYYARLFDTSFNGNKRVLDILKGSKHVNTMYMQRSCECFVLWTLSSAAKIAYSLPFEQQWHVTIFHHFMTKL